MSLFTPDSSQPSPIFVGADRASKFTPTLEFEHQASDLGYKHICGVDEAGRGPLAGPVTAAAVILDVASIPDGLHDSKKLTEAKRDSLFDAILASSWVAFSHISAKQIDRMNIRSASLHAMRLSIEALERKADFALIDGNAVPDHNPCPAMAIVKGDARSLSISAASIVAKVMRDRLMERADRFYPHYGLAGHKGYPTKAHRDAVATVGPCRLHRATFGPVKAALLKHGKLTQAQ